MLALLAKFCPLRLRTTAQESHGKALKKQYLEKHNFKILPTYRKPIDARLKQH